MSQASPPQASQAPDHTLSHKKPDFYLSELRVRGYRALQDATFRFQPTLNVLVGANNSGKTAVIDALRIIFNLGSFQEKEDLIRLRPSDICLSAKPGAVATISFEATFQGIDSTDIAAQFYEMDANEASADGHRIFRLKYSVQFRRAKVTGEYRYAGSQVLGGEGFQNPVSQETLDFIKSIYLAPLRDVVNDSARLGREVERLLYGVGDETQLAAIPDSIRQHTAGLIKTATGNKHEEVAGKNLSSYASLYKIPDGSLTFIPAGLSNDMLRSLQVVFTHGHHKPDALGLSSNGLGINNLIYSSIVLSRGGSENGSHKKRFILIEEPEAHLHPQSQESFFKELDSFTAHQVFVTSHSPTITAKCDLERVIVMGHPCEAKAHEPCHVAEILKGKDDHKRYLHKFLDVTRSQLLFANGAIFVEGVTEAMLLQTFSELLGCNLRSKGVEVIALGSNSGIEHFRHLVGTGGLEMRCAFLTDGDEDPASLPRTAEEIRKKAATPTPTPEGGVLTYKSVGTFELELLIAAHADEPMRQMLTKAMQAARGAANAGTAEAFAKDFMDFTDPLLAYRKMKQKKAGQGVEKDSWYGGSQTNSEFSDAKSEFAYQVLQALTKEPAASFVVPPYIEAAIRHVTDAASSSGTNVPQS